MGRRGQGEMAEARVSSDAMPALTGRRCVGTVQSGRISGKQGGTAEIVFSVLVPHGEQGLFYLAKEYSYDEEITGKAMVSLTTTTHPSDLNILKGVRIMKKFIAVILSLVMMLSLTACASSAPAATEAAAPEA